MIFVALLFPAAISILISYRHSNNPLKICVKSIFEYMVWTIINILLSTSTIVYILGISEVDSNAFNSFPFFTKYVIIALLFAVILPYIVEIIKKYFDIKMDIVENEEEKI